MKKINPLVMACWVWSTVIFFPCPGMAVCPDDMAGYWNLNETVGGDYVDGVGGLTGFCEGECPEPYRNGRVSWAQAFNGSTTRIIVPSDPAFNFQDRGSFTVECWIRKGSEPKEEGEVVIGRADDMAGLRWFLGISGGGQAVFSVRDQNGIHHLVEGITRLNDDRWHHLSAVRNSLNGLITLYVDAASEGTGSGGFFTPLASDSAPLTIGWLDSEAGFHFKGVIDEAAVYRSALSDAVISSHYHNGLLDIRWGYCDDPVPVRIMPLGDSITAGVETLSTGNTLSSALRVGYRQKLYLDLVVKGYAVDFVGSQIQGQFASPVFDADYEGRLEITDNFMAANVFSWLTDNPADIVLLHVGTNSLNEDSGDVADILDEIERYNPEITVVLAKIINRKIPDQTTSNFNTNIEAMVLKRIETGDKIVLVDMENALVYPDDMSDTLHPNVIGYQKMARVWFDALVNGGDFNRRPPVFTSTPITSGTVGQTYTYNADASGFPTPRYRFAQDSSVPEGMTFNTVSGLIEWIVPRNGEFSVAIDAYNTEGVGRQSFVISVPFVNFPPVAAAGADQAVLEGATVTLDGSGSVDPDGGISSYRWRQLSGTPVVLANSDLSKTTFVAPDQDVAGLVFELTVTDKGGLSDTDEVRISINSNDSPFVNFPPVAAAGADQAVLEGATVTLDGSGSVDPDGGISSYRWRQLSGTPVVLANSDLSKTTFVAPDQDVAGLVFELTVTDKGGFSGTDTVRISINSNGIDSFPEGVASFTTVTAKSLGVQVESGGSLVSLESVQVQTISETVNRPEDFIYGMVTTTVKLEEVGGTAIITFFLPSKAPDGYQWFVYTQSGGWRTLGSAAVFNGGRDRVTITMSDGGTGDGTPVDGVITMLSGLAVTPEPEKEDKDELIGCFIQSLNHSERSWCFFVPSKNLDILNNQ